MGTKKALSLALLLMGTGLIIWYAFGGGSEERGLPAGSTRSHRLVRLEDVPEPVRAIIERETVGGVIEDITENNGGDETTYEADILRAGMKFEVKIAADGTVLKRESKKVKPVLSK